MQRTPQKVRTSALPFVLAIVIAAFFFGLFVVAALSVIWG
jgi:hypothetical protein